MKMVTTIKITIDSDMDGEYNDPSRMGLLTGEVHELAKTAFGNRLKDVSVENVFEEAFL